MIGHGHVADSIKRQVSLAGRNLSRSDDLDLSFGAPGGDDFGGGGHLNLGVGSRLVFQQWHPAVSIMFAGKQQVIRQASQ